jgi:hypothetical protein
MKLAVLGSVEALKAQKLFLIVLATLAFLSASYGQAWAQ